MWIFKIIILMGRKLIYELRGNAVISSGVAQGVSFILVFFFLCFCKIHRPGLHISFSPWFDRSSGRVRQFRLLVLSRNRWEVLVHSRLALLAPLFLLS